MIILTVIQVLPEDSIRAFFFLPQAVSSLLDAMPLATAQAGAYLQESGRCEGMTQRLLALPVLPAYS